MDKQEIKKIFDKFEVSNDAKAICYFINELGNKIERAARR